MWWQLQDKVAFEKPWAVLYWSKGIWTYLRVLQKKLKSLRTLKHHKLICKPNRVYQCKQCDEMFKTMIEHYHHKRKSHSKIECSFCYQIISNNKNMSKHLRLKHNNRSPSQTKQMEEIFNSKINLKYKCHECDKFRSVSPSKICCPPPWSEMTWN